MLSLFRELWLPLCWQEEEDEEAGGYEQEEEGEGDEEEGASVSRIRSSGERRS